MDRNKHEHGSSIPRTSQFTNKQNDWLLLWQVIDETSWEQEPCQRSHKSSEQLQLLAADRDGRKKRDRMNIIPEAQHKDNLIL